MYGMNMYLYACMEWTYAYVFVYVDCIFGKHTQDNWWGVGRRK